MKLLSSIIGSSAPTFVVISTFTLMMLNLAGPVLGGGTDYVCAQDEYDAIDTNNITETMQIFRDAIGPNTTSATDKNSGLRRGHRDLLALSKPVSFYAMGDAPYGQREFANLPIQLANLDSDAAEFAIHLGDMQDRRGQCRRYLYREFADMLDQSPLPTFILPGDNDYYDCNNWQNGWSFWKEHFVQYDQKWDTPFNVRYQAARKENFAFTYRRVLFIGIHTLHGRIKNQGVWNRIENDNVQWTRNQVKNFRNVIDAVVIFSHAYTNKGQYPKLWEGLSSIGEDTKLPILFLQGDAHKWRQSTPFRAKNILRTIVDRGGIADPVLVTVNPGSADVFHFERRPLSTS